MDYKYFACMWIISESVSLPLFFRINDIATEFQCDLLVEVQSTPTEDGLHYFTFEFRTQSETLFYECKKRLEAAQHLLIDCSEVDESEYKGARISFASLGVGGWGEALRHLRHLGKLNTVTLRQLNDKRQE